jgi:hypothetical protein
MIRRTRPSAAPTEGPRAELLALRSAVQAAEPKAGRRKTVGTEHGTGIVLARFDTKALAPLLGAAFLMRAGASEGTAAQFLDDMEGIGGISVQTNVTGHQRFGLAVMLRIARPTRRPTGLSVVAQWQRHDDAFTDLKAYAELMTGLPTYGDSSPCDATRVLLASADDKQQKQLNMETDRGVDRDVAMAIGLVVATTAVVKELMPAPAEA